METTTPLSQIMNQIVISPQQLLAHWQGHRGLTRRLIEVYPDEHFFSYTLGGMRPCSALIDEVLQMADQSMQGVVSGEWPSFSEGEEPQATTKEQVLAQWDRVTEKINAYWSQIPHSRFQEVDKAFGLYEGPIYWFLLYLIDNEIHHRGQAYVYLRTLGVEPPAFWDRPQL
ncbi:DinB family protein [Spirosoma oryzicola]|uniref:DinB family protein n=1 Tax=Spirosoma oryzicola TaxID=2898794 RepID=UPI001E2A72A2|nr:DinB family protein [Spirosoma oryzicola]UHG94467.1 DinB family protein [Spirosoma oryzicola]